MMCVQYVQCIQCVCECNASTFTLEYCWSISIYCVYTIHVCVCCSPLHRFQSSPPSGSSPTLSGTQPMSHVAPSSTVTTEGGGGGGGEYRLKEHLEAAEAELFELKSVLQAKVCCEAVSS